MKKERNLSIRLDEELLEEFRKHCEVNGLSISKRIRTLLKNDINKFSDKSDKNGEDK